MTADRVVITGIGLVSAIGSNLSENLANLRQGKSGVSEMAFLGSEHKGLPVGEVKLSNRQMCEMLGIVHNELVSRTFLLGALAVKEALGFLPPAMRDGLALVSGTTVAGMDVTEKLYPEPLPADSDPVHDCGSNTNAIAKYFGCFDYATTISTACSSALNSLIFGKRLIEGGVRDIVVAGGTEALSKFHLNGFKSLMILDERRCRPFDKTRAGLNLGEGAAFIVLERESSALARNASILAVLSGAGNACDAYHQTASSPGGEGAFLAMERALASARLAPADIDYISAHGTGTPDNDASESAAIKRLFGQNHPPVSSTKALTGHTTSASGSIEAAFCILAMNNRFLPKNAGFSTPDESCITPLTSDVAPDCRIDNVMCNSFGFGGNDSSIILSRYE